MVSRFREIHQIHFVDAHHEVLDAQERRDETVPVGLFHEAVPRVDQDDRQIRGRGAGHHVSGVLDVARRVGDDELASWCGKVSVGHVDGDALFALGTQADGKEAQVGVLEALLPARRFDGFELVFEDALAVVEESANEGALAVVDAAGGREAEEGVHFRWFLISHFISFAKVVKPRFFWLR